METSCELSSSGKDLKLSDAMDSEEEAANFFANLQRHITTAEELCERCKALSRVTGMGKLLKKCQAELKFLHGLSKKTTQQRVTHLRSSNLSHLEGILAAVETFPDVVEVLKPFPCPAVTHPLFVDLICNHGYTWVKVIARKAQALHFVWAGGGQFGERNIVDQAQQFVACADRYPLNYKTPQVLFLFTAGVTHPVKDALSEVKVDSHGEVVEADPDIEQQILQLMDSSVPHDSDEDEVENDNFSQGQPQGHVNDLFDVTDIADAPSYSQESENSNAQPVKSDTNRNTEEPSRSECRNLGSLELLGDLDNSNDESIPSASQFLSSKNDYSNDRSEELVSFFGSEDNEGNVSSQSSKERRQKSKNKKRIVDIVGCDKEELRSEESAIFTHLPVIKNVNLDITTLICLVTNLCHGGSNWVFEEDILNQQAAAERKKPLLPGLNKYLQDKDLYVCETALQDFHTILATVGGPRECERAHQLIDKVTIVKDQVSEKAQRLAVSAKIKDRAKIIFGTGETLQAITVSANVGFVRAAANQGVHFATYLIESRALTEQKEKTAEVRTPDSSSS